MRRFEIVPGCSAHVPSLIDLARSVEHLFGPMIGHGFETALEANIERGAMLCAISSDPSGELIGGAIFDVRAAPIYRLSWLAVRESHRGLGVGRDLLSSALTRVTPPARVEVTTFGPDNRAGMPARRLYESFGFRAGAMVERGPEGGTRQRYELEIGV